MGKRWKKIAAILSVTVMASYHSSAVIDVNAATTAPQEENAAETTTEEPTVRETSTEKTAIEETATIEVTIEEASTDETSTKETTADETSKKEESAEETTIEETTTKEASTEDISTEETTIEEMPTEETPVKETAAEEETTAEVQEDGIMSMAEDNSNDKIQPVTNLRWSDETPGEIIFYNPNDENVSFVVHVFKDGQKFKTPIMSSTQAGDVQLPEFIHIYESGNYTFQVETFAYGVEPDYDLTSGYVSEVSSEFVYTRPSEQLPVPRNITWDTTGRIWWDTVEHAMTYGAELYRADENSSSGYRWVSDVGMCRPGYEYFADSMVSGSVYYGRVRAISENINLYAHSDYSDYILFNNSAVSDNVNDKLNSAMTDVTTDTVQTAVNTVKNAFADKKAKEELQIAMQTNSETQEKIELLESLYKDSVGLETKIQSSEDTGVAASSVKLLGAALNATESGSVTFHMTKPDDETQKDIITNSNFTKAIVLDLELVGAGITKGETLAVPVTVTMAAPADININLLTILHYNTDGTYEMLPVRENADGTISFTVTHFSNFIFGEKETSAEPTQPNHSDSRSDSSSSSAPAPSWKPQTADEIKRYAFYSRQKVDYISDVTNAYPVTVVNAMQGKLCFDVFESVLSDYTIGRTYNIFPAKNAAYDMYKMDSAAKITVTIPKELQATGREYKMICVTKGGMPVILDDTDTNPNTITFETDTYYAFALVYKDTTVLE